MLCKRCGRKAERGWRFCPNCGSSLETRSRSLFDEIFSRFRREFSDMDRTFEKEFEALDLSPFFRRGPVKPKGSGFTIRITRHGSDKPKVDVKTFGNVNRDSVKKEVSEEMKSLGPKPSRIPAQSSWDGPSPTTESKIPPRPARVMEEPKARVRSTGNRVTVEMELPDVKSEDEIEITELESSVEVRARAGDKAYFKIITKPEQFSVTSRKFGSGKLHLEFS
jgi:HSP20 family molecular chaperone IbpA